MTPEQAVEFVREQGVVLVAGKGPDRPMTEVIAGEPIRGSWWAHPKGKQIFRVLQALAECPDIVSCRLIGGKVTLVHRRLWPALVRAAAHFPREHLARTGQEHTAAGHHVRRETPFPEWLDPPSLKAAEALTEAEALALLGDWTAPPRPR